MNSLCSLFNKGSSDGGSALSTRQRRQQWEKLVCDAAINPVLHVCVCNRQSVAQTHLQQQFGNHVFALVPEIQDLQQNLAEARRRITTGGGHVGSPMMKILFGDPASMLSLPAKCPTHRSSFWTLPETMTVKRFSQLVAQSPEHSSLHLLIMFLQKVLLLLLYPVWALVAVCSIAQ